MIGIGGWYMLVHDGVASDKRSRCYNRSFRWDRCLFRWWILSICICLVYYNYNCLLANYRRCVISLRRKLLLTCITRFNHDQSRRVICVGTLYFLTLDSDTCVRCYNIFCRQNRSLFRRWIWFVCICLVYYYYYNCWIHNCQLINSYSYYIYVLSVPIGGV